MSFSKSKLTLIAGPTNSQKKTELIRLLEVNSFRQETKSVILTFGNDYLKIKHILEMLGTK